VARYHRNAWHYITEISNKGSNSGKKSGSAYFSNNKYSYYFKSDELNYASSSSGSSSRTQASDRDTNTGADVLWKGKFVSKDAFRQVESWPSGRPEFRVIIAYLDKSSGTATASTVEKILDKDGWIKRYIVTVKIQTKTINVPVFRWYKDRYGSDMKYTWIEQDGGGSTELSINVSSTFNGTTVGSTIKTTIGRNDDKAGEAIVQYENSTSGDGTSYNTGILEFWINQQ